MSAEWEHHAEEQDLSALKGLEAWLTRRGHLPSRAIQCTESLRGFYVKQLVPALGFDVDIDVGVAARHEDGAQDVFLNLLWPAPIDLASLEQTRSMNQLSIAFTRGVALPLLPNPSAHLEFLTTNTAMDDADSADHLLRDFCEVNCQEYFGLLTSRDRSSVFSSLRR